MSWDHEIKIASAHLCFLSLSFSFSSSILSLSLDVTWFPLWEPPETWQWLADETGKNLPAPFSSEVLFTLNFTLFCHEKMNTSQRAKSRISMLHRFHIILLVLLVPTNLALSLLFARLSPPPLTAHKHLQVTLSSCSSSVFLSRCSCLRW